MTHTHALASAPPPFAADWLRPEWDAPARVGALCTTRQGGVSAAPFASMNLGLYVTDKPEHVQHNRERLAQATGARPVFLRQVHGFQTLEIEPHTPNESEADAATTRHSGLACTVMVADCLPVLLCNAQGTQVAAAHAGWRGLLGQAGYGVLESACAGFAADAARPAQAAMQTVSAWLGPCIGPSAFEVGDEVRQAFVAHDPQAAACFVPYAAEPGVQGPKWFADLPGLARQRLRALGVQRIFGNDGSAAWCTVRNPERYFSYRRERISGRMAAAIWLKP